MPAAGLAPAGYVPLRSRTTEAHVHSGPRIELARAAVYARRRSILTGSSRMDRGVRNRDSRGLAGVLFLGAAVSLWQIGAPARVAAAQSDLRFISVSTWTADPAARRVHVQAVVTATRSAEHTSELQ